MSCLNFILQNKFLQSFTRRVLFIFRKREGSHIKYRKLGNPVLTAIIPHPRKEIPAGTFRSILRQAKLSETDFWDLFRKNLHFRIYTS